VISDLGFAVPFALGSADYAFNGEHAARGSFCILVAFLFFTRLSNAGAGLIASWAYF